MDGINIQKFINCLSRAENFKVDIRQLPAIRDRRIVKFSYIYVVLIILGVLLASGYIYVKFFLSSSSCTLYLPPSFTNAFRSPQQCDFCEQVTEIEKIQNVSPAEFEQRYAYSGIPVIVTDSAVNWTGLTVFNFWYFKNLYEEVSRKHQQQTNCQFFPYKSGFTSFDEALDMPENRINYEKGTAPWYFGWSNCNHDVAEQLRKHYARPYFLPETSENAATDWIFMGGPGLGAHLHVDNVRLPSWQAQIKGSKEWELAPPPECYYKCTFLTTVVNPGEIIVLDTNLWYHKTNVIPGGISITIGAEYD